MKSLYENSKVHNREVDTRIMINESKMEWIHKTTQSSNFNYFKFPLAPIHFGLFLISKDNVNREQYITKYTKRSAPFYTFKHTSKFWYFPSIFIESTTAGKARAEGESAKIQEDTNHKITLINQTISNEDHLQRNTLSPGRDEEENKMNNPLEIYPKNSLIDENRYESPHLVPKFSPCKSPFFTPFCRDRLSPIENSNGQFIPNSPNRAYFTPK